MKMSFPGMVSDSVCRSSLVLQTQCKPDHAGGEDVDVLNIQFTGNSSGGHSGHSVDSQHDSGPQNVLCCWFFQCINVRIYISSLSPACEILCTSGPNLMSRY